MPAAPVAGKHLAIFRGGEHSVFTDRTRSDQALAIKAAARDLSLAFLRMTLRNQRDAIAIALQAVKPLLVTPEQVFSRRFDAQTHNTSF